MGSLSDAHIHLDFGNRSFSVSIPAHHPCRPYETLTSYAIRSSDPEEVSMLRWKLTTRRGDAAAEHFHIDHAVDLGPERL